MNYTGDKNPKLRRADCVKSEYDARFYGRQPDIARKLVTANPQLLNELETRNPTKLTPLEAFLRAADAQRNGDPEMDKIEGERRYGDYMCRYRDKANREAAEKRKTNSVQQHGAQTKDHKRKQKKKQKKKKPILRGIRVYPGESTVTTSRDGDNSLVRESFDAELYDISDLGLICERTFWKFVLASGRKWSTSHSITRCPICDKHKAQGDIGQILSTARSDLIKVAEELLGVKGELKKGYSRGDENPFTEKELRAIRLLQERQSNLEARHKAHLHTIKELEEDERKWKLHEAQLKTQRCYYKEKKRTLKPKQLIVTRDFVNE